MLTFILKLNKQMIDMFRGSYFYMLFSSFSAVYCGKNFKTFS
jgi:hypothetical protein